MDAQGVFAVFGPWLVLFALILARISALVLTAPFFNTQTVPMMVKMGLVGTLTLFVMVKTHTVPKVGDLNALRLIGLIAGEILIGALMGTAISILFGALGMAGHLIGTQMGLSMANMMDPISFQQTGLMGQVLNITALLLLMVFDGHLMILRALFESFDIAPVTQLAPRGPIILGDLVQLGGQVFELGLRMSFPVITAVLFINFGLAIVARTVPQVNVFQLGFILTIMLGIMVMAASLPGFGQVFHHMLEDAIRAALRMAAAC
jgi:flagellar biosynthetic protein FliR